MSDLSADTNAVVAEVTQEVVAEVAKAEQKRTPAINAPGVRQSLRPKRRPANRAVVTPASLANAVSAPAAASIEVARSSNVPEICAP